MRAFLIVITVATFFPPILSAAGKQPPLDNSQESFSRDPKMALAERAKNSIQKKERELAQDEEAAFELIEEALKQVPDGTLQSEQQTLDGFRQATGVLRKLAHDLLENRDKIVTDIDMLQRMNRSAVPIYRDGAKNFIEFSKSEPYDEIQEDYLRLAGMWNMIADSMEKRAEQFAEQNKEMEEMLRYLERTAVFLDRLQQHFDSIPDLESLKDRERYLENLRRFIKSFEKFRQLFREFDTELRSNAVATDLRSQKNSSQRLAMTPIADPDKKKAVTAINWMDVGRQR
jgi:hypothetical protein